MSKNKNEDEDENRKDSESKIDKRSLRRIMQS